MNTIQLRAINERLDQVIQFRVNDYDEDDKGSTAGSIAKGVGIAGVGVGGLYGYGRLMQHGERVNPMEALKGGPLGGSWPAAKVGATDLLNKGKAYAGNALGGIKDTFMKGYGREGGGILRGVRGVARSLTKGKSAMVGLSSRHAKLVELNAKLDEVINFEGVDLANMSPEQRAKFAALKYGLHNRLQDAGDRAAISGNLTGGALGAYVGHLRHGSARAAIGGAAIGSVAGGMVSRIGAISNEARRIKGMVADARGQK